MSRRPAREAASPSGSKTVHNPSRNTSVPLTSPVRLAKAYAKNAGSSRALHGASNASSPPTNAMANDDASSTVSRGLAAGARQVVLQQPRQPIHRRRTYLQVAVDEEGGRNVDAFADPKP